jgi:protocatechuate 3,4-dioxygenase beta subunit
MGLVVPVLILPLSMVTTLPMEQLQLVLLHELAHIRRGDYLVNLCQLLAESLLFFNPAVWWISRQIRQEREACCDAVAIALAGERLQYARTLAQVAGEAPLAAAAFGDRRNPSGLKDRIQRLLVPGYRPALRLTWRALLGTLFVGGGLLFLSALGTRFTVAAILSPQQRIARIEKKMTEMGENPEVVSDAYDENAPKVAISGRVRTADGTPVPDWIYLTIVSSLHRTSYSTGASVQNGLFSNSIRAGTLYITADITNFAPTSIGPLDGLNTNRLENLEIVLQRGFDVPLQLVNAENGMPVPDAKIATMFVLPGGSQTHLWKSGPDGCVTLAHCADIPLDVTVNAPGREMTHQVFSRVRAGEPLRVELRRGAILSGTVLDKATGHPIAGADLHLLYQYRTDEPRYFGWDDALHAVGQTDSRGAFVLDQLQSGARYYIGIHAPRHESVVLNDIFAGQSNLLVRLGPELVIRGRVAGNLESLRQSDHKPCLWHSMDEMYGINSWSHGEWVPLHTEDGVTRFQFTNRTAGLVKVSDANQTFERTVDAPVDDWVIDLNTPHSTDAKNLPKREVIFRFKHPSGVPPRGTVAVTIPENLDIRHRTARSAEMEITNGEVRAQIAIGGWAGIQPSRMVGYWFSPGARRGNGTLLSFEVTNGPGPLVIEIPLLPAGAIYASARNPDGTPAGSLFFGVSELKRAPGRNEFGGLDSGGDGFSSSAPRKWVSGPLPLGGTYQIHAWRGNLFCVSKPIKLTEANPDAEIELQFHTGKTFDGIVLDADRKPVPDAELKISFELPGGHSFGLPSIFTDRRGRFRVDSMTPEFGGYSMEAGAPGMMSQNVKLDFDSQPQTILLKPGRKLAGRLVEAGTGYAIPDTEVRVVDFDHSKLPRVETRTDADGRFEFTTLGDGNYTFYCDDVQLLSEYKFRADGNTNVVLSAKLYPWSKVTSKAPPSASQPAVH